MSRWAAGARYSPPNEATSLAWSASSERVRPVVFGACSGTVMTAGVKTLPVWSAAQAASRPASAASVPSRANLRRPPPRTRRPD
ncbi:hypothetical protein M2440_003460 [Methylorubrum extorquens]|nr:hypothetical protein [Methylorubrum extorquens]